MSIVAHPKTRLKLHTVRDRGKSRLMPEYQTIARVGMDTYIAIDLRPNASTSALTNGDDLLFDIEPNSSFNIKDPIIRLRVSCTTARVQTVPSFYLFNRIKVIANKGSGDTLQTIYPEQLINHYLKMNDEEREFFEKQGHFKFSDQKDRLRLSAPDYIEVGETKDIYIPIPLSFWHMNAINLQHIKEETRLRIELNDDFVVNGSSANISLDNVALLIKQDELSDTENREWVKDNMRNEHVYNYLDVIRVDENTQTLNANNETRFDLQNIYGKVAYLIVVVKPNNSPNATDESYYDFIQLPDDATFDLRSPNNESLLGKGNSLRADYIDYVYTQFTRRKPCAGYYLIPFCHDVEKADSGVIDNYFEFVGDKEALAINFGSTGIAEVHTITLTNAANDAGYYKINVKGDMTDSLVFNETAANMKTAFESLDSVNDYNLTSTFSGTAEATFTITYDQYRDGKVSTKIGVPQLISESLNDGGVAEHSTSAVTTYGQIGWENSSDRKVEIHAYYYKRLMVSKHGRLSCRTV